MAVELPQDVLKLIDIYRRAQQELILIIAEKEARGNVTYYRRAILKQVNEELQKLDKQAREWAGEVIAKHYQKGIDEAMKSLKKSGIDIDTVEPDSFAQIHKAAIEILAQNCFDQLHDANAFVGRMIDDTVRQASIEAAAQKFATGSTVKEMKKLLIQKLIEEGINGIKDKRGRMISLDAYAETVARSTTREATNKAVLNQVSAIGYDLVQMSRHSPTCPICAPLQGRVYSISGRDPRFPPLTKAYSGPYANIHPNCRHVLTPYIPELAHDLQSDIEFSNRPFDIDPRSQRQIEAYNNAQKKKAKLRNDRNQWARYRLALPNDTPKTFSAFRRMKMANSEKWQALQSDYRKIMNRSGIIKGKLEDIPVGQSLGAAAKKIYVKNETAIKSSEPLYLKQGTYITGVKVIAEGEEIRQVNRLVETYLLPDGTKTKPSDWKKMRGTAQIVGGAKKRGEVHWYQCENIGKVEWKLKRYLD